MNCSFHETPEFSREIKKLRKTYRSIPDDMQEFKKVARILHLQEMQRLFVGKAYTKLTVTASHTVIKARFDSRSAGVKTKQLLRIVLIIANDGSSATFLELYAKNEKNREDARRIKRYLSETQK